MSNNNRQIPPVQRQSMTEAAAEAEARPLEFDPTARAKYISQMLEDIHKWMNSGVSEDEIKEKVPEFVEKYPELFKKIIKRQDLTPIQSMLAMLNKMGEGVISQHQASIVIGKTLVDRYVTPVLNGNGNSK